MREKLTVIKVGGKIVEEEATLCKLLDDFAAIEGYKVLVHGGGRSATKIAARLGIESEMVNGRRITDAETLKVVTMVYGGLVNKNIVAGLQARGVNALGLTGADMDVIRSAKRPVKDVDYGFVGDVEKVDASLLADLIHKGVVPVMAPLTHDGQGNMLNTYADSIAGEIAAHDDTYEISYLNGQSGEGIFSINGIYAADDMSIRAVGTNLDMAQFSEFVDINLAGRTSFDMRITGSESRNYFKWEIN